jgi:hypothetical protein
LAAAIGVLIKGKTGARRGAWIGFRYLLLAILVLVPLFLTVRVLIELTGRW